MGISNMFKRTLRRAASKFKRWLNEPSAKDRSFENEAFAYPYLNSILVDLHKANGSSIRPHYTWGVLHSVHLARAIGVDRISVIEFGVAGGNGLLALEKAASLVGELIGVGIDVYGFDMGTGMPKPVDYRDLPNLYSESQFAMDTDKLMSRLTSAELVLGNVKETVPRFVKEAPAPIGFISFDLDYYSSTSDAFMLLEADYNCLMPRIFCYFDDIIGFTYSEFTGERLSISEFNERNAMKKISPIFGLKYYLPNQYRQSKWADKIYIAHLFEHPLYSRQDGLVATKSYASHTSLRAR